MWKRIVLGLLTMIAASWAISEAWPPSGLPSSGMELARSAANAFFSAFLGALVARRGFVIPALALMLIVYGIIFTSLYDIAYPQATYASILQQNAVTFAVSLLATAFGAWLGQWLRRVWNADTAATRLAD